METLPERRAPIRYHAPKVSLAFGAAVVTCALLSAQPPSASPPPTPRAFFDSYCIRCHNEKLHTAGLALDTLDLSQPEAHAELLERVIGKLRAGSMPPRGLPRPDRATYRLVATALENEVDPAWTAHPNPGRISAVQRLNRAEYNTAIRDLFAIDVDAVGPVERFSRTDPAARAAK